MNQAEPVTERFVVEALASVATPVMFAVAALIPPVNVVVAGDPKVAAPEMPLKASAAVVEVAE